MSIHLDGIPLTSPPPPTTTHATSAEADSTPVEFPSNYPTLAEQPSQELLSSERAPVTSATLTIRCIKSFEYRTMKALVVRDLDLTVVTVAELIRICRESIKTAPGFKPFRTVEFDTLKLYTQAHSHKTMNLIINIDNDDWILSEPDKTLAECGAVNETEYSLFNRVAYEAFKANPDVQKW